MGGPEGFKIHRLDLVEAGHIVAHIAIRRGDDCGRPAHDMVAGQAGVLFAQLEADMVAGVAGSLDDVQRPAGAGDDIAVANLNVRHEAQIIS